MTQKKNQAKNENSFVFPNGTRKEFTFDKELTEYAGSLNVSDVPVVLGGDEVAEAAYILCSVALKEYDLESREDIIAKYYSEFPGLLLRVRPDSKVKKENFHIFVVNNVDFTFNFLIGLAKFSK